MPHVVTILLWVPANAFPPCLYLSVLSRCPCGVAIRRAARRRLTKVPKKAPANPAIWDASGFRFTLSATIEAATNPARLSPAILVMRDVFTQTSVACEDESCRFVLKYRLNDQTYFARHPGFLPAGAPACDAGSVSALTR